MKEENVMYKSILDMAEGAIKERCDIEMSKIIDNIMDINTAATKARELKLTVKFTPSSDRKNVQVSTQAQCKLQPTEPLATALYIGADENGEVGAVELTRQIPGQMNIDGQEQAEPPKLRLAK